MAKPLPWSFSSLEKYTNCPYAFHEVRIAKTVKEQQGEAALWGERAHQLIEDALSCKAPWHDDIAFARPQIDEVIRKMGGIEARIAPEGAVLTFCEYEMAINAAMQPCQWNDPKVWCRGIGDLIKIAPPFAWIVDWKFGKIKYESRQLQLFAILVFLHFPQVTTCFTSFEWLKFGKRTAAAFSVLDVPKLWGSYLSSLREYTQAFKTDTWQKRPSGLCNGWCTVEHCLHWKPKR